MADLLIKGLRLPPKDKSRLYCIHANGLVIDTEEYDGSQKRQAVEVEQQDSNWHTGTPTEEGWYLFRFLYRAQGMNMEYSYSAQNYYSRNGEVKCVNEDEVKRLILVTKVLEWKKLEQYRKW